jgi:hypothetical protein
MMEAYPYYQVLERLFGKKWMRWTIVLLFNGYRGFLVRKSKLKICLYVKFHLFLTQILNHDYKFWKWWQYAIYCCASPGKRRRLKLTLMFYFYVGHPVVMKIQRCEDNNCQLQLNSLIMLYGFNATCFGSYTRSHHQDDETPQKNDHVK